jgi:hypothetical protein
MGTWLREGFYGGLALALFVALFLMWLWQPERQVMRHNQNFLRALEQRDWTRFAGFIATGYQDQWENDRARLLERTREVFRYLRNVRITTSEANVRLDNRRAFWSGKITIDGDNNEVMALVKERVNLLGSPFELEWRRIPAKPWDWKLVRVSNPELKIPEDAE